MLDPKLLPALPLTVQIPPLYADQPRIHEWDDKGWHYLSPGVLRSVAMSHRYNQPQQQETE